MSTMMIAALVMGVAGSAHCIGMCGPIALAVPSPGQGWGARLGGTLLLNGGRLITYVLIGVAFGAFGHGFRVAGLQQFISIAAGIALLLAALVPGMLGSLNVTGRAARLIAGLRNALTRNLRRSSPQAIFLIGVLNGLLPCGLVYAAAIGAAAQGDVVNGALFMALFGVGTWPVMIALRMSGAMVGDHARRHLRQAIPYFTAVLAVLFILRGMQLDIPYISPVLQMAPAGVTACH